MLFSGQKKSPEMSQGLAMHEYAQSNVSRFIIWCRSPF